MLKCPPPPHPPHELFQPYVQKENHADSCLNETVESWGDSLSMSCFCDCGETERGPLRLRRGVGGGQEEERVSCEGMTVSRQFSPWLLLRDGTQRWAWSGGERQPDAAESPPSCNGGSWLVTATIDNRSLFGCLVDIISPQFCTEKCMCVTDTIGVSMHAVKRHQNTLILTHSGQCHQYNSVPECEICANRGRVRGCRKSLTLCSQVFCTLGSNLGQFIP